MTTDQLKAALAVTLGVTPAASVAIGESTAPTTTPTTLDDLKTVIRDEVAAAIVSQQPRAISFTETFLEKNQVSPQVAAAIAVGAIGGIVEIIKALLPIIFK